MTIITLIYFFVNVNKLADYCIYYLTIVKKP